MGQPTAITTGEQSVTATGPIAGTLSTTGVVGDFTIYVRVRGVTGAQTCRIAIEDTANVAPFSDASTVKSFDLQGTERWDGDVFHVRKYDVPDIRIGATNTALRLNMQAITGGATALVEGWLETEVAYVPPNY